MDREYSNLKKFLKGDGAVPLYSANKKQALRYYEKVRWKEYPLSLRNDFINLRRAKASWFLKILKIDGLVNESGERCKPNG
ncbi:MAG: hypothetical protein ACP5K1_02750 [Candidatus Bathyarchaeia archaeon]